jgi:hypothetical protein
MTEPDVQVVEEILEGLREQTEDPEALHWVEEMESDYHAYLQAHYLNKEGYGDEDFDFDY